MDKSAITKEWKNILECKELDLKSKIYSRTPHIRTQLYDCISRMKLKKKKKEFLCNPISHEIYEFVYIRLHTNTLYIHMTYFGLGYSLRSFFGWCYSMAIPIFFFFLSYAQ